MTEQEYDEIIAPMLADIANRVNDLGGSMIARVEWEKDESGITQTGIGDDSGVGQRMTQLAAHSRGNIDTLCMAVLKRFNCEQSMFLHAFNKHAEPQDVGEGQ